MASDSVTTVTPTYSHEVMTPFFGERLDPLLSARSNCFYGILNGIDTEIFDPANDPLIWKAYDASNFGTTKKASEAGPSGSAGPGRGPQKMLSLSASSPAWWARRALTL